jgi:hypothetical protein
MVQPTHILLNHTGKLHDVLTIAHELGHGINNELIKQRQHALDFGTPTSTAEVASTFMEDFVLDEILHSADDELRFAVMLQKLNDDVSSIFRQVACYRFEQELHGEFRQKGYLSKEKSDAVPEAYARIHGERRGAVGRIGELVGVLEPHPVFFLRLFLCRGAPDLQVAPELGEKGSVVHHQGEGVSVSGSFRFAEEYFRQTGCRYRGPGVLGPGAG